MDALLATGVVLAAIWLIRLAMFPYRRCPRCNGTTHRPGSTPSAFGICGKCGGLGETPSPGRPPDPRIPGRLMADEAAAYLDELAEKIDELDLAVRRGDDTAGPALVVTDPSRGRMATARVTCSPGLAGRSPIVAVWGQPLQVDAGDLVAVAAAVARTVGRQA